MAQNNAFVVAVGPGFVAFVGGQFNTINQRLTTVEQQVQQLGQQQAAGFQQLVQQNAAPGQQLGQQIAAPGQQPQAIHANN